MFEKILTFCNTEIIILEKEARLGMSTVGRPKGNNNMECAYTFRMDEKHMID